MDELYEGPPDQDPREGMGAVAWLVVALGVAAILVISWAFSCCVR